MNLQLLPIGKDAFQHSASRSGCTGGSHQIPQGDEQNRGDLEQANVAGFVPSHQQTAPVAFLSGDVIALVAPCLLLMAGLTDDISTLGVRMGFDGPGKRGSERGFCMGVFLLVG